MGLVSLFISILIIFIGLFIFLKNPKLINTRLIFILTLFLSLIAFFIFVSWETSKIGWFNISTISVRLTFISLLFANFLVFRLILTYPEEKNNNILNFFIFLIPTIISFIVLFTDYFVIGTKLQDGVLFRIDGKYYAEFAAVALLILLISSIIGLVRAFMLKEKIKRLQLILLIIGTSISLIISVLVAMIIPRVFKTFKFYPLSSLTGIILTISFGYSITRTKLFNISSGLYNTLLVQLPLLLVGTFISLILYNNILNKISNTYLFISIMLFILLFYFIFSYIFIKFINKILKIKTLYGPEFQKRIKEIKLDKQVEDVSKDLANLIKETIVPENIKIFIENEIGTIELIYADSNFNEVIDKNDIGIKSLINYPEKYIFFKSEIYSDLNLKNHSIEIEKYFNLLDAEVIILTKEGSNVIMIISLGEKYSRKPYDSYDYKVLENSLGEIFAIGYYLKNIRKMNTISVVEKEMKMSKNIMETITRNIKRPLQNYLDCDYINISSGALGGDFVDFINISSTSDLVVLGDISGKGIVASLSMLAIKSTINNLVRSKINFKDVAIFLNTHIKQYFPKGTFFSGIFILNDYANNNLYFINSGIPVMYYYNSKLNSISQIQGEGKVLGFIKDISNFVKVKKVNYSKGDMVFISTDGFIDSKSIEGKKINLKVVEDIIKNNSQKSVSEILRIIYKEWLDFVNGIVTDDIGIVLFKFI